MTDENGKERSYPPLRANKATKKSETGADMTGNKKVKTDCGVNIYHMSHVSGEDREDQVHPGHAADAGGQGQGVPGRVLQWRQCHGGRCPQTLLLRLLRPRQGGGGQGGDGGQLAGNKATH